MNSQACCAYTIFKASKPKLSPSKTWSVVSILCGISHDDFDCSLNHRIANHAPASVFNDLNSERLQLRD